MGVPASAGKRLRNQLTEILSSKFDVEILPYNEVDVVVRKRCGSPKAWWDCLGKDEVLIQFGQTLEAQTVITGRLAAIGKKKILKLRVADIRTGRVSAEVIEIPAGEEEETLARFLLLHERRLPVRESEAWYTRWETWAIAGAGLVLVTGVVVLGAIYASDESEHRWDYRRTLP
jgi:hypothetical protein